MASGSACLPVVGTISCAGRPSPRLFVKSRTSLTVYDLPANRWRNTSNSSTASSTMALAFVGNAGGPLLRERIGGDAREVGHGAAIPEVHLGPEGGGLGRVEVRRERAEGAGAHGRGGVEVDHLGERL